MNDKDGWINQNTGDCLETVGGFVSNAYGEG